ncbi:MAC/perforin domain protein (macronuclear) [Tetrahymena thermophila SB210]|uniref:MAC/perforin domain protein n=1 Tax=Tetrahymena thermophila (strain SB210) TaxID=312017 RepID=Q23QV6_TETTS|nr:MAC/perforin domain protein [Tetrahymena thermophila SB210]EAR98782.1 MAC/perforin domain protein [Tetrahymena thermophila SB210]|eukprot:XP_001019027.1 MAC/perforin domain protein [Tetrahymena thermophila SB210]
MKPTKTKIKSILIITLIISCIKCNDISDTLQWNDSINTQSIQYIPNVQYLGQGYNIFTSNPHSSQGLDPGYKNIAAINLTYTDNLWQNVNPERTYFVPNGVFLSQQKSCTMSFTARQVASMMDYTSSLEASVSIKGTFFGGRFRASVDYQDMQNDMESGEYQYIVSHSSCSVFQLDLIDSPTYHAQFTNDILMDFQNLISIQGNSSNTEANAYYDFFDKWGTHVVSSVNLGSLFGYKFQLLTSDIQSMNNQGIDVSASATIFNVRGRTNTQIEQNNLDNFSQSIQKWTSYSIGATPDVNNDPANWASQTLTKPMPIKSSITPYHEALNIFTQGNNSILQSSQILQLYYKLRLYGNSYCSQRLLPNGQIDQCNSNSQSDYNFSQQEQTVTYYDVSLLDITRTQIAAYYQNATTFNTQLQLSPIENTIGYRFFFKNNNQILNGQVTYYVSIVATAGNNMCLVGNPTLGEPATISGCPNNDNATFSYIAYDDNIFSLQFKSDPTKCLGFDSQGILRTMVTDSCFECQVIELIQNTQTKKNS